MTPAARVTALLIQRSGARIMVPRRLLAALVAEASPDAAETVARLDAITRAVTHREASLASVAPATVRAYLTATGWTAPDMHGWWGRPRVPCGKMVEDGCLATPAGRWDAAHAIGTVEGRHATLVLAAWLVDR